MADCRAEIADRRRFASTPGYGTGGNANVLLMAEPGRLLDPEHNAHLDAFSAVLDLHEPYESRHWDEAVEPEWRCGECDGPFPCTTVRIIAAGLGVNVEEEK